MLGHDQAMERCNTKADLLLLGHPVPKKEKRLILDRFRKFNNAPALSLLAPNKDRLPDVEYAAEIFNPEELLSTIYGIVSH